MNWVSLAAVIFLGANASALGIRGADSTKVAKAGDTMTGQLTTTSTITVQGDAFSVGVTTLVVSIGNVGIGTASPLYRIHVADGNGGNRLAYFNDTSHTDDLTIRSLGANRIQLRSGSSDAIVFGTGGSDTSRLEIESSGNIGINDASSDAQLEVLSGSSGTGFVLAISSQNDVTGNILSVLGNGNVGIGTDSPATTLDVIGNAQFGSGATQSTFTTTGALNLASNASLTATGASGNIISAASITASGFFGNGSALTGLASAEGNTYTSSKTFTAAMESAGFTDRGQATVTSTVTVQGNAFSVGVSTLVVTGGNVGIGTASPASLLDISASGPTATTIQTTSAGGSEASLVLKTFYRTNRIYVTDAGTTGMGFVSGYPTSSTNVFIADSGNVGIGTTNPNTLLEVNGTLAQKGSVNCAAGPITNTTGTFSGCVASDMSLKKDIKPLVYSGTVIDALRPVSYRWKSLDRGAGVKQGFIAQDVEKVIPNAIVGAGAKLKGVDSNALIAALVLEVQDLRRRVKALEK